MRPYKVRVRKRRTSSEAEPLSSRPLLIASKNTDGQKVGNEQGDTEAHVEPSSTSNSEGFEAGNEADKILESQDESAELRKKIRYANQANLHKIPYAKHPFSCRLRSRQFFSPAR